MSSATVSTTASAGESPKSHPSPFTILTGLIDRPIPGENQTWLQDFELLHHYLNHTKYIVTDHNDVDYVLRVWQEETPKVAFRHDYVMHGLLGFSALHMASQDPAQAQLLRTSAVDHLDKALVLYRQDKRPVDEENANAKFVFTWLVALFAFAIPPSVPPIDAIVELFLLVKGIDTVLAETWYWVAQGPFAPILTGGPSGQAITSPAAEGYVHLSSSTAVRNADMRFSYTLPEGMDFGLNHLDYMIGVDAMLPDDRRKCALVLAELKQVYDTVLRAQGNCSIAQILVFPKQDSAAFSQLVKRRVPQALIILAHYCVLLDVLDTRWWIHGWSSRVLRDILGTLEEQWRTWIEWPVQSVLLKERAPSGPADLLI